MFHVFIWPGEMWLDDSRIDFFLTGWARFLLPFLPRYLFAFVQILMYLLCVCSADDYHVDTPFPISSCPT